MKKPPRSDPRGLFDKRCGIEFLCYFTRMEEHRSQIIAAIFPYIMRRTAIVRENNIKFSHYTSAQSGLEILRSESVFLRNSVLMNDFSELQYGQDCLINAYRSQVGEKLKKIMNSVQEDLSDIIEHNFDLLVQDLRSETYLMSLSEHGSDNAADSLHEDMFGRLSMWRAYAPKNGVSFIMNNEPFLNETNALNAYTSPVHYVSQEEFLLFFEEMVGGFDRVADIVKLYGGQYAHDLVMNSFKFLIQSTKHPSFKEEKEWRIIYDPLHLEKVGLMTDVQKERIPSSIRCLNGIPQKIYEVPFKNYPEDGMIGSTVPELIDKILIGPSMDGYAISQAFISELERLGVQDAVDRVKLSGVPLRV